MSLVQEYARMGAIPTANPLKSYPFHASLGSRLVAPTANLMFCERKFPHREICALHEVFKVRSPPTITVCDVRYTPELDRFVATIQHRDCQHLDTETTFPHGISSGLIAGFGPDISSGYLYDNMGYLASQWLAASDYYKLHHRYNNVLQKMTASEHQQFVDSLGLFFITNSGKDFYTETEVEAALLSAMFDEFVNRDHHANGHLLDPDYLWLP